MEGLSTLHEICLSLAKKQPGMADSLTEDAPILKVIKWKPSTHGLWNVAEQLREVNGPGWTKPDAPLPMMSASSDLVHTDLHAIGGIIEVPTLLAKKFGGAAKYFAEKQNYLLRTAGQEVEKQIVMNNWLKYAKLEKVLKNAGGTGKGWFILAVRFHEISNVGLYDPDQFGGQTLLKIESPYGGNEHYLHGKDHAGVLGFSVTYRGIFGWQLLPKANVCGAIVNIDETHKPTVTMIDDLLADVRAQPGSTYLFCSPKAKIHGINPYKTENVQLANNDTDAKTRVETWNGISIVASHNINGKIDNVNV